MSVIAENVPDKVAIGDGAWAMSPWQYNDPASFTQGHGKFSETAVYARGNAFPWRMCEIACGSEEAEIATARLIAAAPDLYAALEHVLNGALSLPRFAEEEGRAALAKATGAA